MSVHVRVRQRLFGILIAAGLTASSGCGGVVSSELVVTAGECEGRIEVSAVSARTADTLAEEIASALRQTATLLAATPDTAPLAQLNRLAADAPQPVRDPELWRAIDLALEHARLTAGAFDPTLGPLVELHHEAMGTPVDAAVAATLQRVGWERVTRYPEAHALRFHVPGMRLDLSGFACGYAIDVASRKFARAGSRGGVIRLCDVAYTWGRRADGSPWPVTLAPMGLTAIVPEVATIGEVALSARAVSMTTRTEALRIARDARPSASIVVDRRTGQLAASDVLAAVVIADSAADATALARALLVAGSRTAGEMLAERPRLEAVLLVRFGGGMRLLISASLSDALIVDPSLRTAIGDDVRYVLPPARR